MMQERKRKPSRDKQAEVEDFPAAPTEEERAAKDAELDALLDEIDDVLVENAEAFIKGFRQQGGQ